MHWMTMSPEHLSPIFPLGVCKIVTIDSLFDEDNILFSIYQKLGINEVNINTYFQIPKMNNKESRF